MILRNIIILSTIILMASMYYWMSITKNKTMNMYAFYTKLFFLGLSLMLTFVRQDFIVIGNMAFGGRTSVMMLIMIEIIDSLINKKKED